MKQDLLLYPAVRKTISIAGLVLAMLAIINALLFTISLTGHWGNLPTLPQGLLILCRYAASVLILLLIPPCMRLYLAGQGTSFLRFIGNACIFWIPAGLLVAMAGNTLQDLWHHYASLMQHAPITMAGKIASIKIDNLASLQCLISAGLVMLCYPYTKGYRFRRVLMAWPLALFGEFIYIQYLLAQQANRTNTFFELTTFQKTLPPVLEICYWTITALLAWKMATTVNKIATLPKRNRDIIPPRNHN